MEVRKMFSCAGWRQGRLGEPVGDQEIVADFMEDGTVRQRSETHHSGHLMLGSWRWKHEECAVEVFIPGHSVDLLMDDVVTNYLHWIAKQVLN